MDYSTEDIVNAYKSNRLEYIRADKTDGNLQKVALTILQDPVIQALSAPTMLLPKGPKEVDSYIDSVVNSLLGVAICLREDDDNDKAEEKERSHELLLASCASAGEASHQQSLITEPPRLVSLLLKSIKAKATEEKQSTGW